ncbi:hypothetical protein GOV06_02695 [Candidatus Woesearchaeota archaeon]|nr:hypothetical protein [Candidatus Woesearchaeota archaeon]
MAYSFEELKPLETREIIHISQMGDNRDENGNFSLLRGKKNTFFFEKMGGYGTIYRPFEPEVEESLDDLVSFVKEDCASVNLRHFPPSVLDKYFFTVIPHGGTNKHWRLYQTPLTVEDYDAKLKKFRKTGYEYRELTPEDTPKLIDLIKEWARGKKESAMRVSLDSNLGSVRDIDENIEKLQNIRSEVAWLDFLAREPKEYEKLMAQPLTTLYGTFRDGQLLSYIYTEGNEFFMAFHSRASKRVNSRSPQEFLDLAVAREFAQRGVKKFDRGFLNIRKGMIGLIEYKKKFGEIKGAIEINWDGVYLCNSPEYRYLQEKIDFSN